MTDENQKTEDTTPLNVEITPPQNAFENEALQRAEQDETVLEVISPFKEHSTIPALAQLSIAILLLGVVFGTSYIPGLIRESKEPMSKVEERIRANERSEQAKVPPLPEPTIGAEAAYVWDAATQKALYNKNASAQLPLASLTKLMTALVSREVLTDSAQVSMTLEAIQQDGESGFLDGDMFKEGELSDFALISSSNDAAFALAAAAGGALTGTESPSERFVKAMNLRAEEIGLLGTHFTNPTGLDASMEESGAYGTARDMTFLMEYLIKKRPEVIESSRNVRTSLTDSSASNVISADNTNEIISKIPGLLGSKTGYTELAGGNLVIVFDAGLNHPIIVSVLGSSRNGRFEDVLKLVKYARATVAEPTPVEQTEDTK